MLSPKWGICLTPSPPKPQESSWKRNWKEHKSQKQGIYGLGKSIFWTQHGSCTQKLIAVATADTNPTHAQTRPNHNME